MVSLTNPDPSQAPHPRVPLMLPAVGGFPPSDRPLFEAGYSELCRIDLSGRKVLEICCGAGKLVSLLAEGYPEAEAIGLDRYESSGEEIKARAARLPGLSYVAGDAMDLSRFAPESLDLVFGQAALHHLAHDVEKVRDECLRVLKPGGRLVFIFEPLGHNPLVAAIRAARFARAELGDESNLFLSQFERMAQGFSSCEVQVFNLLGYPMKAFSDRFAFLSRIVQRCDHWLLTRWPGLRRQCANGNLVFTK